MLDSLNKNYSKLQKYQIEKLNCLLNSKELSVSKNKNFKGGLSGKPLFQASNKILKNTLAIRDTYLDPLSLIQVFLMQKLQNNKLSDYEKTSLLLSINGLAAGLRNTG